MVHPLSGGQRVIHLQGVAAVETITKASLGKSLISIKLNIIHKANFVAFTNIKVSEENMMMKMLMMTMILMQTLIQDIFHTYKYVHTVLNNSNIKDYSCRNSRHDNFVTESKKCGKFKFCT